MALDTATYPVARGFTHGLMCAECGRQIPNGAPYAQRLISVSGDNRAVVLIVCVYCDMEAS